MVFSLSRKTAKKNKYSKPFTAPSTPVAKPADVKSEKAVAPIAPTDTTNKGSKAETIPASPIEKKIEEAKPIEEKKTAPIAPVTIEPVKEIIKTEIKEEKPIEKPTASVKPDSKEEPKSVEPSTEKAVTEAPTTTNTAAKPAPKKETKKAKSTAEKKTVKKSAAKKTNAESVVEKKKAGRPKKEAVPQKEVAADKKSAKVPTKVDTNTVKNTFVLQSNGKDYTFEEITELCKKAFRNGTKKNIKTIDVYVKPENDGLRAYYVANGIADGSYIDL